MTGRSSRHSTTRLWTGIVTLLLVSETTSSQGRTALDEAAPSLHSDAITESPFGSVAPLRKVDGSDSTTLKDVHDVPDASAGGAIGDKLLDSFTTKSNGSQDEESLSGSKSEKLRIQEPLTKVSRLEEKRAVDGSLLEFSENEDNGEIDDLEGDNDREPMTPAPKRENAVPKNSKHKGKEPGGDKPQEKIPEIEISLANDTDVNYNNKKPVKGSNDEGALGNDSNGPKGALENATNVIASGADAGDGQEKGKGPKAQVEVMKNSTLPKVMRINEAEEIAERKEVEDLGSAQQESVIKSNKSTVIPESMDLANAREKTSNFEPVSGGDVDGEKANSTKAQQSPKGRTISFSGINEFVTNDNKTGGPIRNNGGITDRPMNKIITGVTKEPVQAHGSTAFKPYPYVKTNYQSNSSEVSLTGDARVRESTEEASALENTIGQRQQDNKFVVTEPSVVIDNSIQQFKPTYYKRSGNSSRIPTSSDFAMATTASSLQAEGNSETTLSAKSIALEKDTTLFVATLPVSNTENDVSRGKGEATRSSLGVKDTSSSLDLTGNGITEVIAGIKNDSVRVVEDSVTTASLPLTTSSMPTSRATENTLVQNSTEKVATITEEVILTNVDVQTDPEESMLKISSFNVTEGSTRMASNQGATYVVASTSTLSTSTLIPESSSQSNFTPETSSMSPSVPSKTLSMSTLIPESSLVSNTIPESSSVSSLTTEAFTMSTTTPGVSSILNSSPMPSSVSTSIPTSSSLSPKATSPSLLSTQLEVQTTTVASEGSTDGLPPKNFKTAESDDPVESTTSRIEYVFVGLTESTVSPQYEATSESSNNVTFDREVASSTPSSVNESSTLSSTFAVASTTLGAPSNDSVPTETAEQISTDPVTLIADNETSDDSTATLPTLEFTTLEDSTISMEEDVAESTTTIEEVAATLTNESVEATTEEVVAVTNSTSAPGIIRDLSENTTDTGRAVDSLTSVPDGVRNFSATIVSSTEATNLSITTEVSEFSEVPKIPSTNLPSESSSEKPTISTSKPDVSTTSEDTIDVVTDDSIEISGRAGVPSLVKVIFEGSWPDVCPHVNVLRQSLADLLTSGLEKTVLASQIIFQKNPCSAGFSASTMTTELSVTTFLLYVVDENGNFDGEMTKALPNLYSKSPIKLQVNIRSFQLVQDSDSGNAIAVVVVSCVALICLILLAGLLFIMRKRQTRFNYGERCRPVSLDAYSLDSVSAYNSVRRKGAARASKRSYGNPTFEDSSAIPSHPLNFAGLSTFCNEQHAISEEFAGIPQVTARIDELPPGAEVKNRYANVVPLPETRVSLMKINNDPLTEYINASYVRGPKNATKYYIACQAPIESTVTDFWRMIWEQQSKVVIMLTDLVENGVEKCAEYVPPSEVTDCHRLFGDFQVTLKKRETKEKYAISTLHLKNLENNTFREISHIWYLWPANGVQSDAAGLIAVLLEARALQRGGPGPIVVHCSPGTGRTGTLIALDLGIRQYEITRTVDVPRVVYTIRRDRAGAVQTKEQYAFIYKALNLYATKLAGGALES